MVFGTRSATTSPGSNRQRRRWGKSCAVDIIMLDSPWIDSNTYLDKSSRHNKKTHGPPNFYNFSQITYSQSVR